MTKPPLLTPRHYWYRERVQECLEALLTVNMRDELDIDHARELAKELLYCTTEWDKYYNNSENK